MYVRPLSTLFLLLGVFLIAKANDFPEKIGLEQICERVVEEAKSMDVEDFLEQDQLLRTAEMCEKYLKDVNPDLNEVHLKSSGFEDKCILKVYSKGSNRGLQFDIEKTAEYSVGFPVKSIRNVGECCWKIRYNKRHWKTLRPHTSMKGLSKRLGSRFTAKRLNKC